jgi:mannonate dehydratase
MGKGAGMPVYNFLGGKVRAAVPLYAHAAALEMPALIEQVQKWREHGPAMGSKSLAKATFV